MKIKDEEYIRNLEYLSGGNPNNGFTEKLSYYLVFFMNAVQYNERKAKELVDQSRRLSANSPLESNT